MPNLNALKFIMESRIDNIGRALESVKKEKLPTKNLYCKSGLTEKGDLKRTRAEESIIMKLKKLADRLKKMLTTEESNDSKKKAESESNVFSNVSQKTETKTNKKKKQNEIEFKYK